MIPRKPPRSVRNPYYAGPVSDHFDGVRFFSPSQPPDKSLKDLWRWRREGGGTPWPKRHPSPFRDLPPARTDGLRAALIGHASFLIQAAGLNILVDPVFSERASPVPFAGPKRVNPPGIAFEDLPPVDAVLITHNHYDHLDLDALGRLWRAYRPRVLAPLGNDAIVRARHPEIEVETRDWGQSLDLGRGVAAHLTPACHWSARGMRDRRMALWCAYVLTTPVGTVYHVGDTGFGDGGVFREVRARFGPPRLANLPIGAYEPRWFMKPQHMNPEDAVRAFRILEAEQALGHHWGTFRLTDEGIEDPPRALAAALAEAGIPEERFRPLRPGEAWEAPHSLG
ncbi:MBL fold metallo-hydrolase [Microvirga thermotolerans]|uniref:MBL fold metallo-hydrolase n=1 Tax=Microvirga thermotolerans TaxID=2651334 RepID=A0A5P9JQH0_9HYPH|nr:MBL fold metallo-hydrolase [Microvirga thermotolerans]QFU15012.1 MBL fold metallo-hydrolase [Microvirga thermotolerans]